MLNAAVDNFVPDAEVDAIKTGTQRRVYIWGTVMYRDEFGAEHQTEFSQSIIWLPNGTVFGNYHRRNSAT
jgi:hypothetical protein